MAFLVFLGSAKAFETDDAYDRKIRANQVFYAANTVHDYKLTPEDGKGWEKYKSFDANADGVVSFDEFLAKADLPYAKWDGEVQRNVVCKRVNGVPVLLDIYAPQVKKYKKAPVFYYTHGGGWTGGTDEITDGVRPLFEALSKEGFVCVSIMYRLVKMHDPKNAVIIRDEVADCRDGLRFLKKHEKELGIDMNRVVVFGSSAGGHLAQMLTFTDTEDFIGDPELAAYKANVAAGLSWFGPCDFRSATYFVFNEGTDGRFAPDFWTRKANKYKGKDSLYDHLDPKTEKMLAEISPVCWLDKDDPPLLHYHGDKDPVISYRQAIHLKEEAEKKGAKVEIRTVKNGIHGWWNQGIEPSRKEVEKASVDFILEQVGGTQN
jgi:acetyl esterase/lipase